MYTSFVLVNACTAQAYTSKSPDCSLLMLTLSTLSTARNLASTDDAIRT